MAIKRNSRHFDVECLWKEGHPSAHIYKTRNNEYIEITQSGERFMVFASQLRDKNLFNVLWQGEQPKDWNRDDVKLSFDMKNYVPDIYNRTGIGNKLVNYNFELEYKGETIKCDFEEYISKNDDGIPCVQNSRHPLISHNKIDVPESLEEYEIVLRDYAFEIRDKLNEKTNEYLLQQIQPKNTTDFTAEITSHNSDDKTLTGKATILKDTYDFKYNIRTDTVDINIPAKYKNDEITSGLVYATIELAVDDYLIDHPEIPKYEDIVRKNQQEFVQALIEDGDYWLKIYDTDKEKVLNGVLFSTLTLIDGCSGRNDFTELTFINSLTAEELNCGIALHEIMNETGKNDLIDHLQIIKNEALNSDLSIKDSVDKLIKSMCEYFAGKTELNKHTVYDVISIIDEEDTIEEWNTSELDKCYENIKEKDNKNFEEER